MHELASGIVVRKKLTSQALRKKLVIQFSYLYLSAESDLLHSTPLEIKTYLEQKIELSEFSYFFMLINMAS
jgi:hypothetical protein